MRKLARMMIAILMILFAITMEASRVLGSSSSETMRRQEASCLVFRILISLWVSEKNATSEPLRTNESKSRKRIIMARRVVAWGLITKGNKGISKIEQVL